MSETFRELNLIINLLVIDPKNGPEGLVGKISV